jgi:hypothetical protein
MNHDVLLVSFLPLWGGIVRANARELRTHLSFLMYMPLSKPITHHLRM